MRTPAGSASRTPDGLILVPPSAGRRYEGEGEFAGWPLTASLHCPHPSEGTRLPRNLARAAYEVKTSKL